MNTELSLLYPEWQSYGVSTSVYEGAMTLAESLFDPSNMVTIDVSTEETLTRIDGVLALDSIATRFRGALETLESNAASRVFMIGGTCGVDVAPVSYLNHKYGGDLAVVWLDAHGDLNTPASSLNGHFHGMPLRTLLGEGPKEFTRALQRPLLPQQVFLAGTRDLDPPEVAYTSEAHISISPPEELATPEVLVKRICKRGFTHVHLHLDLDVLDPESFPDSLMPTPGGPSLAELAAVMRALAESLDVVGLSVVEYCEHQGGTIDDVRGLVESAGMTVRSR